MAQVQSCGVYARISRDDDGTALGVGRQLDDCRREAERRGWPITREFIDNDVSASSGRFRPEYEALMSAIRAGAIDALVVWDVDRLTRTPAELESFIDLADRHTVALASVGGDVDLSTPQGRLTARIKGSVARHEVEQQSRRLKRKFQANAAQGQPHGVVPFGYRREKITDDQGRPIGNRDVIIPEEAAIIHEWYRRVLSGETLRSIAKDAKARGIRTRQGNPWPGVSIGRALRRPTYLGLRTHKGEVVGPGNWEPIIDRDTFDRVTAILTDPNRRPTRGPEPRYLGSGIYLCGRCGTGLRPIVQAKDSPNYRAPTYGCPGCNRLTRKLEAVDEVVNAVMIARLSRPDVALDLSTDPSALRDAMDARDAIAARMDTAADEYAEGTITARQLARITDRLKGELETAERRVAQLQPVQILDGMTGEGAEAAWWAASLEKRRAVLREVATVTILPTGPGIKFAPEQVRIDWNTPDA
ncbi:recombinase family protein [Citricoccus sp.]|uniref:recombinase family protein n=1 Tax=Citricoccus sp. TaxID=1978372 RepID=UPI002605EB68|nr:recombinase family protein [Citricoccus sp.]HRO30596.1 recombinase family protein [Citricoccus sp.]